MTTTLDLHSHSEASEDSRAPLEAYLNWLKLRRAERPVNGIVLTEHRQFNKDGDYRASFVPDESGIYDIKVSADRDQKTLGAADMHVRVSAGDAEYFDAGMRAPLLRRMGQIPPGPAGSAR